MASIVYLALWSCFRIYRCAIQRPSTDNHIWMLTLTLHWLVLKVKKKVSSLSTHDHLYSRPCCSYLPFPLLLCYHCFWDFHLLFSLHLLFLVLANFTLFSFGFCSLLSSCIFFPLPSAPILTLDTIPLFLFSPFLPLHTKPVFQFFC